MSWSDLRDVAQETILDVFAERDPAGEISVSYEVAGGAQTPIRAVYRDPHLEQVFEVGRTTSSTQDVRVDVKIADLPHYPPVYKTDRVVVRRPLSGDPRDDSVVTRLELFDHLPDGEGLVRLRLRVAR